MAEEIEPNPVVLLLAVASELGARPLDGLLVYKRLTQRNLAVSYTDVISALRVLTEAGQATYVEWGYRRVANAARVPKEVAVVFAVLEKAAAPLSLHAIQKALYCAGPEDDGAVAEALLFLLAADYVVHAGQHTYTVKKGPE